MALTIAHLSDLHLGQAPAKDRRVAQIIDAVVSAGVDHVVVTGDITHGGRLADYRSFLELVSPLERSGRLTVIPGNHDRCGDDVAELITGGRRVWTESRDGLHLICVDSTAPHNRTAFRAHGEVCARTLDAIDQALARAPEGALTALLLHHHLVPLPVEGFGEWIAERFGWPHASELKLGKALLRRIEGRCDLVLHGHRHVPRAFRAGSERRPLRIFNAGSSTELMACRLFDVEHGRVASEPQWLEAVPAPKRSPVRQPQPQLAVSL